MAFSAAAEALLHVSGTYVNPADDGHREGAKEHGTALVGGDNSVRSRLSYSVLAQSAALHFDLGIRRLRSTAALLIPIF